MNLYLRYFDNEVLVSTVDEAIDFLSSIPEIKMTPDLENDIREYVAADAYYPKRYKVRPRVYFIIIKTEAACMADFKAKKALRTVSPDVAHLENPQLARLNAVRPGWYEGTLSFKRVLTVPSTGKCEYRDTVFSAQVKAKSGMDCYKRIVDHLLERVDSRSQFPSAKGKNFSFKFLGTCK